MLTAGCSEDIEPTFSERTFESSFESVSDFDGFYITPTNHLLTSHHELNDSLAFSGNYSHKAWITGPNQPSYAGVNNNHRAYPTIQLYKTEEGAFTTPCYITFWVWLDMELNENSDGEDDWFSFATLCSDNSDDWTRTVLVNLSHDGFVHLMHVPNQDEQEHVFQTSEIIFPQKEWVQLKIYIDFGEDAYAKVWQNNQLVSHAYIDNVQSNLEQAHFGLYCFPQMELGVVYNDDLVIRTVEKE